MFPHDLFDGFAHQFRQPGAQPEHAVLGQHQMDFMIEGGGGQREIESLGTGFQRRLGLDEEIALFHPNTKTRSARLEASNHWPTPEMRNPGARLASRTPRRKPAVLHSTSSIPLSSAKRLHSATALP